LPNSSLAMQLGKLQLPEMKGKNPTGSGLTQLDPPNPLKKGASGVPPLKRGARGDQGFRLQVRKSHRLLWLSGSLLVQEAGASSPSLT